MSKPNKARDTLILVVVVIVAVAAVAGFGFYRDEITVFFRLQAWNLGPLEEVNRKFIEAASKNDGAAVEMMLDPKSKSLVPMKKNDKITAFRVAEYGGPQERSLTSLFPSNEPRVKKPYLVFVDGGVAVIDVTYPKVHTVSLRWDLTSSGWKVTDISRADAGS